MSVGEGGVGRDRPDMLEKSLAGALGGPGVNPRLFEAVADGVYGKRQQVHGGEPHGEVLLAVAEVVLEVVAVGLEDVEALVLDLPACPGAGHDLAHGAAGDGQRGHEGAVIGRLAASVGDGDAGLVDQHRVPAAAQRRLGEPAQAAGRALAAELPLDCVLLGGGTIHEVAGCLVRRRLGGEQDVATGYEPDRSAQPRWRKAAQSEMGDQRAGTRYKQPLLPELRVARRARIYTFVAYHAGLQTTL